jgi:hypothetical protein
MKQIATSGYNGNTNISTCNNFGAFDPTCLSRKQVQWPETSGVDQTPQCRRSPHELNIEIRVSSVFGLDSVLLAVGSILDPYYEA